MKQADNVVRASQLLDSLAGQTSTDPSDGESSRAARSIARSAAQQKAEMTDVQTDFEAAYSRLVEQHPVTLEGGAPDKALRADTSPSFQRKLYERWVKAQMKLRKQHIHYSEEKVSKWISDRGWRSNIPSAAQFVDEWKPHGSVDTALDAKQIRRLTRTQRWKGLIVTEDGGKGKGVIATRRFLAGEVVWDYHGQVVTASEGHSTHSTVSAEDGVHIFFFFENMNGQAMCSDAHSPCCECHPDRQTFGRLINHSRKRCNLRPRAYTLQNGVDIIIFLATKNINENEELLFDYGVERRSFIGKGLNLLWV
ncbi:N-lysine methyltransferase KMT5A-A-like [Ictalurus punctatus]|uniref:N-lysine methyltransferase KMT5A-A-like n=1 Tax=Ictalurus punctatus TaxID=7998 RepID=A0A9F7TFK7_ICTPU|nr:N-lysine methyltransferase KMT5A-A-like [Ictalurus punctatus]